jgi:hypothetical protein
LSRYVSRCGRGVIYYPEPSRRTRGAGTTAGDKFLDFYRLLHQLLLNSFRRRGIIRAQQIALQPGSGECLLSPGIPFRNHPRLSNFWRAPLYTEPEYKQHKLEVLTTVSKDGSWGVEVTVNWQDDRVGQTTKYGPYQGFISPADAQSRGIIRS